MPRYCTETYRPPEMFGCKSQGGVHRALTRGVDYWSYGVTMFKARFGCDRFLPNPKACVAAYIAVYKYEQSLGREVGRKALLNWISLPSYTTANESNGKDTEWYDMILNCLRPVARERCLPSMEFFDKVM